MSTQASKAGFPEFVSLYVLQGARVNEVDDTGWGAAHHAACNGNWEVYDALRIGDADFDQKDYYGNTPMHVAAGTCVT